MKQVKPVNVNARVDIRKPIMTLKFYDRSDFTLAVQGHKFWECLWDMDLKLRGIIKYGHKYKTVEDLAEDLRKDILESVDINCVP